MKGQKGQKGRCYEIAPPIGKFRFIVFNPFGENDQLVGNFQLAKIDEWSEAKSAKRNCATYRKLKNEFFV